MRELSRLYGEPYEDDVLYLDPWMGLTMAYKIRKSAGRWHLLHEEGGPTLILDTDK